MGDNKPSQEFRLAPQGSASGTSRDHGAVVGRAVERPADMTETWLQEMAIC